MSLKNKLRNATIGKPPKFRSEIITIEGEEFEIRQPSMETKAELMRKSKLRFGTSEQDQMERIDILALQVWSVIYCTYVPDTDEKVFSAADFDALKAMPTGSFVDKISGLTTQLMQELVEEDVKNFESPQDKND